MKLVVQKNKKSKITYAKKKKKKMKLLLISEGRGPKRKAAEEYLNASSIRNTTDTT